MLHLFLVIILLAFLERRKMLSEESKQKVLQRINPIVKNNNISIDISYSTQEKNGIYQCIIKYQSNGKWKSFWATTGIDTGMGNKRAASRITKEIVDLFQSSILEKKEGKENNISIEEIKQLTQINTTNYDLSKETKADWDFYKYMEHWLEHIIKNNVGLSKYIGYEGNVKNYMKEYFSMDEHKKL